MESKKFVLISLFLIFFSLFSTVNVWSDPLAFTDIRTPLKYYFSVTKDDGKIDYANGTDSVEQFSTRGKIFYREVTNWYFHKNNKHKYEDAVMVKEEGYIYPLFLMRVVKNKHGDVIREEKNIFDLEKRQVRVIRNYDDPTKEDDWGLDDDVDKIVTDLPNDVYTKPMINMCLRSVPLQENYKFDFHLITRMGMVFKVYYRVDGVEKVSVPAGEFECFRVKQNPEMAIGGFNFAPHQLSPSQLFWYTVEEPHQLIKYIGFEESPAVRLQYKPIISGKIEVKLEKMSPMGVDDVQDKALLLKNMRSYDLLPELGK